jgi:hypothetical protein
MVVFCIGKRSILRPWEALKEPQNKKTFFSISHSPTLRRERGIYSFMRAFFEAFYF